jgi:hypothetical protein
VSDDCGKASANAFFTIRANSEIWKATSDSPSGWRNSMRNTAPEAITSSTYRSRRVSSAES